MYQADRGNYRTNESVSHMFTHSCLGRLIIFAVIAAVLLFVAHITVPNEQTMKEEMEDNILQCIAANDSIPGDWIDDAVNNIGYIFTTADSTVDTSIMETFYKFNRLEYYKHTFFATTLIHNNFRPEGTRAGIGIFGIVIPTANFNDFLLRVGPMHKGYNKRLINSYTPDEYYGDNPNIQEYHYKGEVDN